MTGGPQYNFNGSIRTERDVISWGGMVPSEGGFVYRGGTTPEGGIVFSEGGITHLKDDVLNTGRHDPFSRPHYAFWGGITLS